MGWGKRWKRELRRGFLVWFGFLCGASCCAELIRYVLLYSLKWGWSPMRMAEILMGLIGIVYIAWTLVALAKKD